jgi:PhnB protein
MPLLAVRRGSEAIEFYRRAFGAVVEHRGGDNGSTAAQLSIPGATPLTFWVSDEAPELGTHSPESIQGSTFRVLLVVDDPEAVFARALTAGATEVRPVVEQNGWRVGHLCDPYGHRWEILKPLVPWPPTATSPGP